MHLQILSLSDVHGYLYPTDYSQRTDHHAYGWLQAATVIEQQRAQAAPTDIVLTIDNGDWIQGSPLASYVAQHSRYETIFTTLTNNLGIDVGVLGNHEFNYGLTYLRACEARRNYPLLGANIIGGSAEKIIDAPYHIIERQGVRIAILGLTTAYIPVWEPARHLGELTFESALTAAKRWVPRLRELADVVIVAYHGGYEADLTTGAPTERLTGENEGYQLLTQVPGIDALITGHQHRHIAGVYHGIPTTQPGDKAVAVGAIDLTLDQHHHVIDRHARLLSTAQQQPAGQLAKRTQALQDNVQDWLDEPVGQIKGASLRVNDHMAARLNGHPYLAFVNTVEATAGQTDIAATALFNDSVYGLDSQVTRRNLLNSYPYPNTLVVERITGADLRAALERCASFFTLVNGRVTVSPAFMTPKVELYNYDFYSGINYTFDLTQPVGQRVTELRYHGRPIKADQLLDVTMNQYRGNGGGDYPMFNATKIIREVNTEMATLLQAYLEQHPTVTGRQPHNLTIKSH